MSKQQETSNPLDLYENWRTMRDVSLETWSKAMIDWVNSEPYSYATSQWLDNYLVVSQPFLHTVETIMTQVLARLNMPMRSDMTILAERLTSVEMRLDDMDAKLDEIQQTISAEGKEAR
jgi:hypothetical protein